MQDTHQHKHTVVPVPTVHHLAELPTLPVPQLMTLFTATIHLSMSLVALMGLEVSL